MDKKQKWMIVLGVILIVSLIMLGFIQKPQIQEVIQFTENTDNEQQLTQTYIYVDIKGAVTLPGVYKVVKNTRLFQVVNLAGGLLDDADENAINLSMILGDQDVIYVPRVGEDYPNVAVQEPDSIGGVININTASLTDFESLPGIGPATAQNIIDYREENGPFETIEDIMNVSGIGESTFEDIRDSITT